MQKYDGLALDMSGAPVLGASVRVTNYESGTLASLFQDDESTPMTNPMSTDSRGRYSFNAVNGKYNITITKGGDVQTLTKQQLQDAGVANGVETIQQTVTQVGHGLVVGNAIRYNGTAWVKSKADSALNAEVHGIVSSVAGSSFTYVVAGKIQTLSGLIAGTAYFLSPTTAGAWTTDDPAIAGDYGLISRCVFFAISTTTAIVYQDRGFIVTNGAFSAASISYTPDNADLWSAPLPTLLKTAIDQLIQYAPRVGEPRFSEDGVLPSGPFTWLDGRQESKVIMSSLWRKWGHMWEDPVRGGTAVTDSDIYFRMPNFRGVVLGGTNGFGIGGAAGRLTFSGANTFGRFYGEEAHVLTVPELAAHTHVGKTVSGAGTNLDTPGSWGPTDLATGSTGNDAAHNTMQPTQLGGWYCRY